MTLFKKFLNFNNEIKNITHFFLLFLTQHITIAIIIHRPITDATMIPAS